MKCRLQDVLYKEYQRVGAWTKLCQEIEKTTDGGPRIDRRKLKRFAEGSENVGISIAEFKMLDRYLCERNEGLAERPLFQRDDLLDAVMETDVISFFVPSKYDAGYEAEVMSRWDMRSVTRLLHSKLSGLQIRIWDVASRQELLDLASRSQNQVQISIGSPFASAATEQMLARMIGVEAFRAQPAKYRVELPFWFVFPGKRGYTFIRDKHETHRAGLNSGGIDDEKGRAIVIGRELFISNTINDTYALLVAQRQPPFGHIHVALCGLSGPATYSIAKRLQKGLVPQLLPPLNEKNESHSPILFLLLRVTVELLNLGATNSPSKRRRLVDAGVVVQPRLLRFTNGAWSDTSGRSISNGPKPAQPEQNVL